MSPLRRGQREAQHEGRPDIVSRVDDHSLVLRAMQGDRDAFGQLVERYSAHVYALAYAKLANHGDAEEASQEAFLRAYERLGELRTPDRFDAWLTRIALSRASNRLREREREIPQADPRRHTDGVESAAQQEFECREDARRLVDQALCSLPDSLRLPMSLRYFADASYRQIGDSLLIQPAAAQRRVSRALAQMRSYLKRRGITQAECRTVLAPTVVLPAGSDLVDGVMQAIHSLPAPRTAQASPSSPGLLACAGAGGVLITGVLAAGLFLAAWAGTRASSRGEGDRGETVALVEWKAHRRSPIPENAILVLEEDFEGFPPGMPLPGWTDGVYAQSDDVPPGGGRRAAMVNTNIPPAYYRFPLVHGVVTVELWMKPRYGPDANCLLWLGNHLRGWQAADYSVHESRPADGNAVAECIVVQKGDGDTWEYPTTTGPPTRFADYDGDWHHVRVRYDTRANQYDLYLDRALVRAGIPGHRDISDGVSCVSLSSGRWHRERDKASLFDSLRVYVEPEGRALGS